MSSIENLLAIYPDAEIAETTIEIGEDDFTAQVAKNARSNAEGGTLGVVWVGKAAIVLVRRSGMHAGWALPGGTVEAGEDFDKAFLREVKEETSVSATLDRLLLLDRRVFVSPSGERLPLDLAVFEATAEPDQTAKTTAMAVDEGLEVATFGIDEIPSSMIFKDKERVELAIASRIS